MADLPPSHVSMPYGPNAYVQVIDERATEARATIDRVLALLVEGVEQTRGPLLEAMHRIYLAGLRDGFMQGVAAETHRNVEDAHATTT